MFQIIQFALSVHMILPHVEGLANPQNGLPTNAHDITGRGGKCPSHIFEVNAYANSQTL